MRFVGLVDRTATALILFSVNAVELRSPYLTRRSDLAAEPTEAPYKSIFSHACVGIAQTDVAGRFLVVNSSFCDLAGRTSEELLQASFGDITEPGDAPQIQELLAALQSGMDSFVVDTRYIRPDGSRIWVNHSVSAVRDGSGSTLFLVAVAQDISGRKRIEESLRQREEQLRKDALELEQQLIASGRLVSLGELTASMAHEFNNPLGIVLGFTQDLLSEMDAEDPNYRFLQIIDEEAKRCEKIVQDLLEFARPRNADFVRIDVNEVMKKTLEMISSKLFKQKVEAAVELAPNLPLIHADPQQLQQVLANLCLNAMDAMPDGGKLTVSSRLQSNETIAVAVADTGFGIDAETLQKIFQPFFTAKKRKGLGLGLSVCDRIVKAHGGSIVVKSTPDRGSVFTVQLPVSNPNVESRNYPTSGE